MTVRTVKIEINCGPMTCASVPGEFCAFVGTRSFGTKFICTLFPDDQNPYTPLTEKDGWLQRCDDCLATEE